MSCHEGVSCDNCMKSNFSGKRFKCLICFDYDLCEDCHFLSISTASHSASHAMQCILTRHEFGKYYGGESISPESPPSFVCPFCGKLGFTENLLREHVVKEHEDSNKEVICPVCAALPSGDPNLVTEDLAHHLSVEHRAARDNDDSSGRHIRRMFYPGRGIRSRNHRSMHFSGGPIGSSLSSSNALSSNNNVPSSIRDSMDPIAELLSQLSGVRRSANQLQQNVTTASQLQELQSQLQLERHRAAEIRQQLERFPSKSSSSNTSAQNSNPRSYAEAAAKSHSPDKSSAQDNEEGAFLLSNLDNLNLTEAEQKQQAEHDVDRGRFVQELILSMLTDDDTRSSGDAETTRIEKAIPIQCPLYAEASTSRNLKPSLSAADQDLSFEKESSGASQITKNKEIDSSVQPGYRSLETESQQWRYDNATPLMHRQSDVDEDKPPSPTPLEGRSRFVQARMYAHAPVRVGGFADAPVQLGNYEEVGSGSVTTKHVH